MLYVHQEIVNVGQKSCYDVAACARGSLDRRIEAVIVASAQKRLRKIGLCHALATRKGNSAAASLVISAVSRKLIHKLSYGYVSTHDLALTRTGHFFYVVALRFGVAAPTATKITALEKDNRSYTGSVVQRISLYIKYSSALRINILIHAFLLSFDVLSV
jgi:hypothetical protein